MVRKLIILLLILVAASAAAQTTGTAETSTAAATSTAEPGTTVVIDPPNSGGTRQELHELLRRYPPEVGRVLKLDPSLFANESYLANYPALAAFVKQHPEVPHSPRYFLEDIYVPSDAPRMTPQMEMWNDVMEGVSIFVVMSLMVGSLMWLIKTLIDHRRWSHLSRVQFDVHSKLMDRFSANEELLAYVQTPAGKRFLESAPIPVGEPPAVAAPVNRILWSVQVGLVIAAVGIGLQVVTWNVHKDVAEPMFALSVLATSLGFGFILSAIVSYLLSRKLGLWQNPPQAEASGE